MSEFNNVENLENQDEDLIDLVILKDEEGNELQFEVADLIEYEDYEYVVLISPDEENEDIIIMKIVEIDDETETLETIDSQELLDALYEIFKERCKDIFNFVD